MIQYINERIPELAPYFLTSEVQLYRYNEPRLGIFIAESAKVILRALESGYEPISLLVDKTQLNDETNEVIEALHDSIAVYIAEAKVLKEITGFNLTRGVLCAMCRKPLASLEEVCQGKRRIAVLDDVENPTNVGAIFRSAAAMGIQGVVLTKGCTDPLYRRAIRVSMGNVFQIPWTFYVGTDLYSRVLPDLGYKTAAMALEENSVSIDYAALKQEDKLAVVLGNEGTGLNDDVIKSCDYTVMIPMMNGVDSLNVAAASAVAFWELR